MRRGIILLGVIVLTGLGGVVIGRSSPPATTQALQKAAEEDVGLDRMVASVDFKETPLDQVMESLREQTKTNLVVNWGALEGAGIDQKAPISIRLNKLPLGRVLEVCLDLAGQGTVSLGYKADRGVIRVSTEEELTRNGVVRMYDIRDLIQTELEYRAKTGRIVPTPPGGSAGNGPMSGASMFSATGAASGTGSGTPPYDEIVDTLRSMIMEVVAPDAWRDNGGTVGSVREFGGRLIITATPEMHVEIAKLLDTIRKG